MNDVITTDEDTSKNGNVLTNDIGEGLTVTSTGQKTLTSGATVNINSDGTFTYNPNSKFELLEVGDTKIDTFNYSMKDSSGNTGSATVTVTIKGVADSPVAVNDTATTDEDTDKEISVLENDSDPNTPKGNLTITKIGDSAISVGSPVTLLSGATVELILNTDSSKYSTEGKYILKYDPSPSASLNLLNKGQSKTETFTYTVSDPEKNTDQGSVSVKVEGITDTYSD